MPSIARQFHVCLRYVYRKRESNLKRLCFYSFIYFFSFNIKEFPRAIIEKKKKFSRSSPLWTPVSLPLFFFAIQKLLINGDFEKNNEAIHLFSLSHVGKSNENWLGTRDGGWIPYDSRETWSNLQSRRGGKNELDRWWSGVEGEQFGENISNSSRSNSLISLLL